MTIEPVDDRYVKEGPFQYDDGRFIIWKSRWNTWCSADSEGRKLVSGLDRDSVEFFTREKLNGYPNCWTSTTDAKFTGDTL